MSERTVPPFTARLRAWGHLYADDAKIVKTAAEQIDALTAERDGLRAELARVDGHRRELDRETANLTADVSRLTAEIAELKERLGYPGFAR